MVKNTIFILVFMLATLGFFVTADNSIAGGAVLVPSSGGDGVVRGNVSFPNEVFVSANQNDGAAQAPCSNSLGTLTDIQDMNACFLTKTSGLIQILYCGVLDNFNHRDVSVRALVDSSPGNDKEAQPGNLQWSGRGTADDTYSGASCFTWIGEVENEKNCGIFHRDWCWTQHCVKMQCGANAFAQFNERVLKVFYNKFFETFTDLPPL
jgi:hypothetical protein